MGTRAEGKREDATHIVGAGGNLWGILICYGFADDTIGAEMASASGHEGKKARILKGCRKIRGVQERAVNGGTSPTHKAGWKG